MLGGANTSCVWTHPRIYCPEEEILGWDFAEVTLDLPRGEPRFTRETYPHQKVTRCIIIDLPRGESPSRAQGPNHFVVVLRRLGGNETELGKKPGRTRASEIEVRCALIVDDP